MKHTLSLSMPTRKEILRYAGALCVMAFLLFGNILGGEFVYDDTWVIGQNPTLSRVLQIPAQFVKPYHYLQPETGLYRPLTLMSFSLNFIFGRSSFGFHVGNVLLHAINSLLVFLIAARLFKSKPAAYIASLLFIVLPVHTEAVAFISGRADLLACMFGLLSIWYLLRQQDWMSAGMFALGLFAKESVVGLVPVILFIIWRRSEPSSVRRMIREAWVFIPGGLLYILLRWVALGSHVLGNDADIIYNPLKYTNALSRFLTALKVLAMYVSKAVMPIHLSADYSFNQIPIIHTLAHPGALAGLVMLGIACAALVWPRTRRSPVGFSALFFLSTFFVISNFIVPIGTVMAERTFYLPSVALCWLVGEGFAHMMAWRFRRAWIAVVVVLCALYGIRTIARNPIWQNRKVLFEDMVAQAPASIHAKTNLAIYDIQNGKWEEGKRLLNEVYPLAPEHLPILDTLGIIAEHEQRYADAEQYYLKAISLRPHYATGLSNLARMYFQLGTYDRAAEISWREFSYHQSPSYMMVYAMSQSKLGNYDTTIAAIKQYYGEDPLDLNLQFALGYAYFKKGDRVTADRYFAKSKNPAMSDEEFIKSIENF
jgi:Flp pilus assembly protein TadD